MFSAIGLVALLVAAPTALPAEVALRNGVPCLLLDGVPQPATCYMTYQPAARNFQIMGEAGVHLYSFSATATESTYNMAAPCWVGPEDYDYSAYDTRVNMLLGADPEARFLPRVFLGTPDWWADAYPEDLVRFDPGDGTSALFICRGKRVASWASLRWRKDTAEALRRFIAHNEAAEYADRVVGYHLASGTTEEWMQWGGNEDQWADYSAPNRAMFQEWLQRNYGNDDALQTAWGNDALNFASAEVPARKERAAAQLGYWKDPGVAQPSIDYVLYTSWLTADTIEYFARLVKERTKRERLVGVFYGYVLSLAGGQREQNAGHLAIDRVFASPNIDFVSSPSNYTARQLGTGYPYPMALLDSVKRHGKLWFNENDQRTWLTKGLEVGRLGKTATYEETLLNQKREFAWSLVQRVGMWWFDMGGGWYDDPRLLRDFSHMNQIAHERLDVNGASVAEIAFVVDPKSSAYLQPGAQYGWCAQVMQQPVLGRVGAPFATITLGDLEASPPYKVYIFANCFAPSREKREAIRKLQAREDVVVLWLGPAGLYRDGKLDTDAMKSLTGFALEVDAGQVPWRATPTEAAKAWGWTDAAPLGSGRKGPCAVASAEGVRVLATLEDGRPGIVAREEGRRTIVHSTAPLLSAGFMRTLAEKAGVHCYAPLGDIVWASRELLALSVNEGGPRTIHLPESATVVDLWTGKTIAENAITFEVDIAAHDTALFQLRR